MKVIAGLGNPGKEYAKHRHNVGFRILEDIAKESGVKIKQKKFKSLMGRGRVAEREAVLVLPQDYMNCSGGPVQQWMRFYKVLEEDLIVVHDDLDLPFGKMKLGFGSSAAGHNGVSSIIEALGTKEFYRLRFGIGRPASKGLEVDHVLSPFKEEEKQELSRLIQKAAQVVKVWIKEGYERAKGLL